MLSADDREELTRMRDALAERMHALDEQVSYGQLSLEEKHDALSREFGSDYQETLASMNHLLHKKPSSHHVLPHSHLTIVIALVAVVLAVGLVLSAINPSVTAQAVVTDFSVSEQHPVRLSWDAPRELIDFTATHEGGVSAELVFEDSMGAYVLAQSSADAITCSACPQTLHPPVLVTVRGEGTFVISSLTARQKP